MTSPKHIQTSAVSSSLIHSAGHDAASNTLAIRFKDGQGKPGALYHYSHVTPADFAALTAAKSLGVHFNSVIKASARHTATRVDG
ncbi:MAG: KTSC domain-containing protein [Pararobbsia sp.]